jgi:hypothetical protein
MSDSSAQRIDAYEAATENRRRKLRTHVPSIEVMLDEDKYVCDDWGLGGCRITNYKGDLQPGDTAVVELFRRIGHEHTGLCLNVEVLRIEPEENNTVALRFEGLTGKLLSDFCRSVESELRERVEG